MDEADIEQLHAFEHLRDLRPNLKNAFLFDKKLYPPAGFIMEDMYHCGNSKNN